MARVFWSVLIAFACLGQPMPAGAQPVSNASSASAEDLGRPFATAFFMPNSSEIEPAGRELLDLIAEMLNGDFADKAILIIGHAAKGGDPSDPEEISAERARQVGKYLVGKGVDADRITLEWRGADAPLLPGEFALNRRAEIYVR